MVFHHLYTVWYMTYTLYGIASTRYMVYYLYTVWYMIYTLYDI